MWNDFINDFIELLKEPQFVIAMLLLMFFSDIAAFCIFGLI